MDKVREQVSSLALLEDLGIALGIYPADAPVKED